MTTTKTTEELEKAKFYLEEAHRYYDSVNDVRRKLDDKIHNFIVLSGVLVNVTLGLALIFLEKNINNSTLWFLLIAVSLYLVVIIVGLTNYRPLSIRARDIKKVIEKFEKGDKEFELLEPMQHLAWNLSRDAEENEVSVSKKARYFEMMLIVFGIGIFFLVLAIASLAFGANLQTNLSGNLTS